MQIGIIGAGLMAQAVGRLAIKAGHSVMLSNSRGARSLVGLRESLGCETGSPHDAAVFGDIVFAAIPLQAYQAIPAEPLVGKIILNPQNYFSHFGLIPALDNGGADHRRAAGPALATVARGEGVELYSCGGRCA